MTIPTTSPEPPDASAGGGLEKELLLADLENWGESFWKNEEAGEGRVSFYVTLVTAVMAGLAGLYQYLLEHPPAEAAGTPEVVLHRVAVPALLGLTLVGVITFLRMLRRNIVTDTYKENADAIRRYVLGAATFKAFYRVDREDPGKSKAFALLKRSGRSLLNGGLTVTMAGLNALVLAVLKGINAWKHGAPAPWSEAGWVFAAAFLVQVLVSVGVNEHARAARKLREAERERRFAAAGR